MVMINFVNDKEYNNMSENYKVHKAWIKEAEFEILVLEIPKVEIEDKLAYLARDKGNITRSFYEDFVIATCVANINQLLFHIKQQSNLPPSLMQVREEVMKQVLLVNPLLEPNNLVINRNSVIKLKGIDGLKDDERLLIENKHWAVSYYDEVTDTVEDAPDIPKDSANDKKDKKSLPSEMKNIEDLSFETSKQWWKRINRYVEIKKYNEKDIVSILSKRFFHNRSSFQTYIVSVCVVDSEDLFIMLDNMGVPNRVAPPILMHEVYELCKESNPFLTYENAQELTDKLEDEDEGESPKNQKPQSPNRMASHARQQNTKKKKQKKTFKDVHKEDLLKLADTMKVFVIGQDAAVDQIVEAVQRASVGLKDPVKPIGSFLFAGRTGVGKTLTTKVLADELIKDRNNLVTIDCSEYSADHEYAKLIGSPSGYVGHEQGGILTNAILEDPFSVVVFDEIEKASHKVHEIMLQILEEGRLTDGKGQKVSFKDTVIIMTSNIGVSEVDDVKKTIGFGDVGKLTEDKKTKAIDGAIKKKFKPEFLNRIDSVVHFRSLTKADYVRIIDIELYKLNENLRTNDTEFKDLELEFDKKIKAHVFKHGIDEDFGARPLKRCIEKEIATPLAVRLLRGDIDINATVLVTMRNAKVDFNIIEPEEKEEASVVSMC
jgi:ATP-dependent Clp protease ATP-binding subunit ClpA